MEHIKVFFGKMLLRYASYACQNHDRTEVIGQPESLIFTKLPLHTSPLLLCIVFRPSSPFTRLLFIFPPFSLSPPCFVTDWVRKTRWKGWRSMEGVGEAKTASHVKCQKAKALRKQTAGFSFLSAHLLSLGCKGGWPKWRDSVIIYERVCLGFTVWPPTELWS